MAFIRKSGFVGAHLDADSAVSYTFPSLPAAGNLLIARFSAFNGGGGSGVLSVSGGGTWTVYQFERSSIGILNRRVGFAYLRVPAGLTGALTVTLSATVANSSLALTVAEYDGIVATGDPLDQVFDNYSVDATTIDLTSAATTQASELVVTGIDLENWSAAAGITVPSGYTLRDFNQDWNAGPPFGSADKFVSATGVQSPVWTFGSSPIALGFVATFKQSVAAGGVGNTLSGGGEIPFGDLFAPVLDWAQKPPASAGGGTSFTVAVTARDDVSIARLQLFKNGVQVGDTPNAAVAYVNAVGRLETGVIQWRAVATDSGAKTSEIYATTTIQTDTSSPVITLSASSNFVSSKTQQVTLTAVVTDNTGIDSVKFFLGAIGSGVKIDKLTAAPFRHVLSFADAISGPLTYYAAASDAAGNVTNSNEVVISVSLAAGFSIQIVTRPNLAGNPGGLLSWTVRVLNNGIPAPGVYVVASSSVQTVFAFDATNAVVGTILGASSPQFVNLLAASGVGTGISVLAIGVPSGITDERGEVTFTGHVNPSATAGQTSIVTFGAQSTSADGSVTVVIGLIQGDWVTVYRDVSSWVQVQRDSL